MPLCVPFMDTFVTQLLPRQYPDSSPYHPPRMDPVPASTAHCLPLPPHCNRKHSSTVLPRALCCLGVTSPSPHFSLVSPGQLSRGSFKRTGLSVLIPQRRKQSFCPGALNQKVFNFIAGFFPVFCTNSPLPNPKTGFQFWTFVPEGSSGTSCTCTSESRFIL